jgi:hypothetical protein
MLAPNRKALINVYLYNKQHNNKKKTEDNK